MTMKKILMVTAPTRLGLGVTILLAMPMIISLDMKTVLMVKLEEEVKLNMAMTSNSMTMNRINMEIAPR